MMNYKRIELKGKIKHLDVMLFSDWHVGSSGCDESLIDKLIAHALKNQETTRIIINGDLLENATRYSVGSGVYEQTMSPQQQLDYAVKKLKPVAHLIDGFIVGNHTERTKKEVGIDLGKVFSDMLGIEYLGYRAVVHYSINKNSYPIMLWHGAGSGSTTAAIERRLGTMDKVCPDAMVYVISHFHKPLHFQKNVYRVDKFNHKLRLENIHYICTNTALMTHGYADMAGFSVGTTSQPIVRLGGKAAKKEVKVKWIEGI
ncbi:hypothetical protein CPT_Stahl29 [Bacillus phage Stahl]|uniref:DNA repair exonuclease n=1 Tax=Bacillus phage Stahl TaxID=1610832 RepID=A0A0E3JJ36_9CAUD|nr:DNA repair exonuclease [Bacillus phage Stahl]AKA61457.1 hypothetical protein CPT_Stahl29 [Bacillus phage Stahl]